MIQCPKCGAENMLGAIFCRSCGDKLNLDDLTPETLGPKAEPAIKKLFRVIGRTLTMVILLALLGILVALMVPTKIKISAEGLDEAVTKKADAKIAAIGNIGRAGRDKISFSNVEATYALNKILGLPSSSAGTRQAKEVSVTFLDGGTMKLIFRSKLYNVLPIYTTVVGRPEMLDKGNVNFVASQVKMGVLPMVGPLQGKELGQIGKLFSASSQVSNIERNVDSIQVTFDKGLITLRLSR